MAEASARDQQMAEREDPQGSPQVAAEAPPPYSSIAVDSAAYFDNKEYGVLPKLPSYKVATTLPPYNEAVRTKAEATVPMATGRQQPQRRERLETFDDIIGSSLEIEDSTRNNFGDVALLRLGNDGIFMLTLFMTFLFNWIGFFLSFCLTTTAAGRFGAVAGLGLSLIKWILIVRFSSYFHEYFDGIYWLWWVFFVLGSLLILQGLINYVKVRKIGKAFSTIPRSRVYLFT